MINQKQIPLEQKQSQEVIETEVINESNKYNKALKQGCSNERHLAER